MEAAHRQKAAALRYTGYEKWVQEGKEGTQVKKWFASKEAKKITVIIIVMCVALAAQIIGFVNFNQKLYDMSLEHSMQQVQELSGYVEKNLHLEIDRYVHILMMVESQIEQTAQDSPEEMAEQLRVAQETSHFKMMGISDLNGKGVDSTGGRYDIFYEDIRETVEKDQVYISNAVKNGNETLLFLAVPLKIDGQVCGVVWGKYALADLMETMAFSEEVCRYFQIVDDRGKYLFASNSRYAFNRGERSSQDDVWSEMEKYVFSDGMSIQKLHEMVQRKESGHFYFEAEGQGRYVSFRPLKINNWYLFSVQVEDDLHTYVHRTRGTAMNLLTILAVGLLMIFGAIYNLSYTMYKEMANQNREIQAINAMFRVTLQQTRNIPFVIDQKLEQVVFYGYPTKDVIKYCSFDAMRPEELVKKGILDKDSLEEGSKMYRSLIGEKKRCDPVIVRACVGEKKEWLRISITSDAENSADQIFGVLEDYSEQKGKDLQIENHLDDIKKIEKKSQIDFLTGLYNRETFLEKVQTALEQQEEHQIGALLIMDLDHFKEVNDRMGHGMGDAVLRETASTLRSFFRREDIVGRLGGDEFMVFAKNIRDIPAFEKRLQELNQLMCSTYQKDGREVQVSGSIGVMLTDREHRSFESLYEKADLALYQVKQTTRNDYCIYREEK